MDRMEQMYIPLGTGLSIIVLDAGEIYSFIPDSENDTFGPGRLWTHNYFFVK